MAVLTAAPGDPHQLQAALLRAMDAAGPAVLVGADPEDPRLTRRGAPTALPDDTALPEDTALVLATSGSTGVPKLVALGASALTAAARATSERIGEGAWVLALPPTRIAGIQMLVRAGLAGQAVIVPEAPGAAGFLAATAALPSGVRAYTSLVPAQLAALVGEAPAALARYEAVLVGGQRTPPDLVAAASAHGIRLVRTYGSTETAGGCVYDGAPLGSVRARIDEAGQVLLAGPMLASGYIGDPDRTRAAFPVVGDERWYRTGDLGELSPEGILRVTGRGDNVIVSGGVNVSLDRVEELVRGVPSLADAVVVPVDDARWGQASVIVTATGSPADLDAARRTVGDVLGREARPRALREVESIPLLSSGKPDRQALREAAARPGRQ